MSVTVPGDIVIDEEKMEKAATELAKLSEDMSALEKKIDGMLEHLKIGFDTPAGRKFVSSCRKSLLQPMKDQALAINHVSENLKTARSQYQPVFKEYQQLNQSINNT